MDALYDPEATVDSPFKHHFPFAEKMSDIGIFCIPHDHSSFEHVFFERQRTLTGGIGEVVV